MLRLLTALLLFATPALADGPSPKEVVQAWTRLYGRDAVQAAALTTRHFRGGEDAEQWGEKVERILQEIEYGHLGGEVIEETIAGEVATITLQARIVAVDGVSLQKEVYTLKCVNSRWLIDSLGVKDEVVPEGKLPYNF